MSGLYPAFFHGFALDPIATHDVEDECRRFAARMHHALPAFAVQTHHVIRIELETGNHLTVVAAGCAPARFARVDDDAVDAAFAKMQRARESRVSRADDRDVRANRIEYREARA